MEAMAQPKIEIDDNHNNHHDSPIQNSQNADFPVFQVTIQLPKANHKRRQPCLSVILISPQKQQETAHPSDLDFFSKEITMHRVPLLSSGARYVDPLVFQHSHFCRLI
jgi:hypothetical protein